MIQALLLTVLLADPPSQDALVTAWLKVSLRHAQDYGISPRDQPGEVFRMLPQAVFRHSQPVRGDDIGAVYLWVDGNDRPAVIGTTFAFTHQGDTRNVVHEFHSLADTPLSVEWRGAPSRWRPETGGLEWRLFPDAPAVDKTPSGRQRQARLLARQFSALSTDHKGGRWELRLVPKPLHQFDKETPAAVRSGQTYALCQGTDPELILLLETRPVDGGTAWHFAAASFTDYALSLKLREQEVWSSTAYSAAPSQPHWVDTVSRERLPAVSE